MRILLVNPPNSGRSIPEETYGITAVKEIFRGEPLGLEAIAGNLDGHDVAICDLKAEPDSLWTAYEHFQPQVVGFTAATCEANRVIQYAGEIKKSFNPVIVVGGHHASCDPAYFNRACVDYVVAGLGKASFRELIDRIEQKEEASNIPGVARTNREEIWAWPDARSPHRTSWTTNRHGTTSWKRTATPISSPNSA